VKVSVHDNGNSYTSDQVCYNQKYSILLLRIQAQIVAMGTELWYQIRC